MELLRSGRENLSGEDETFTSKLKVGLARLPLCHPALKPHLQRVNHRVVLFTRADESSWKNQSQGWIRIEDGVLERVWFRDSGLPNSLVDLLDTGDREEEEEEEEENEERRV